MAGASESAQRQAAEFLAQRMPPGDHPGHGHGERAARRQFGEAGGRASNSRVSARGAQPLALRPWSVPRLGVVDQREQVAADAVAGRLHQPDGGVGRDGRVDGVAAALEHLHAGARGQRLAGRDDAESVATCDRPVIGRRCGVSAVIEAVPTTSAVTAHEHKRSEHEILQRDIVDAPTLCAVFDPQSRWREGHDRRDSGCRAA